MYAPLGLERSHRRCIWSLLTCVRYARAADYNAFVAKHRSQIDELYELSDDELGKGAFGVVLKGRRVDSGLHVAVKRLSKAKIAEGLELLHNEIAVWEAIDHPHLVQLLDVFEDPEHLTLITEHMRGGDLFVRLKSIAPESDSPRYQPSPVQ